MNLSTGLGVLFLFLFFNLNTWKSVKYKQKKSVFYMSAIGLSLSLFLLAWPEQNLKIDMRQSNTQFNLIILY